MWVPRAGDIVQIKDNEESMAPCVLVLTAKGDGFVPVEVLSPDAKAGQRLVVPADEVTLRDDLVRVEYVSSSGEHRQQQLRRLDQVPEPNEQLLAFTPEHPVWIDYVNKETDHKGPIVRIYLRASPRRALQSDT